jgi:hypothetical protein
MKAHVNADYVHVAARCTLAERAAHIADTDEAIAKGAVQGSNSVWPDPKIALSHPQTPAQIHWTRHALRLTPAELEATRAALAALPPTAKV